MPLFKYNARDRDGQLHQGELDVLQYDDVVEYINKQQWILISVRERRSRDWMHTLERLTKGVKHKHVVIFARQLAVLVSATVPIVRALRILSEQSESKVLQGMIVDIALSVDGGMRLSAAMHKHPQVFDDFFVYMIRAGETTGRLDEVLVYLADQKEKDYQLMSRIISSLIYPAFIVVMLLVIFTLMMIFVVPKLLSVISTYGASLPLVTRILIRTSDLFQGYWWVGVLLVVALIGVYAYSKSNEQLRAFIDRVKIATPILGNIFMHIYLARMSRSLANLLASGVPVNKSLEITADVIGNQYYRTLLLDVRQEVESGMTLSHALKGKKHVPPMVSQMMSIGEETGRLDHILTKVSDFYVAEVDSLTQALISLIEPLIIVLLGIGALILVSGILLPIYAVTGQFAT